MTDVQRDRQLCGCCDAGLPMTCTCPPGSPPSLDPVPPGSRGTIRLADVAYETTEGRCRSCGGLLCLDVGGDAFGNITGAEFCLNCDRQPETYDWATM